MQTCVFFPGGAGGNWLSHTIFCLENNIQLDNDQKIHFHRHKKSNNILLTHCLVEYNSYPNRFCFSDKFAFNFYLNGVKKFLYEDNKLNEKLYVVRLNMLTDYASSTIDKVFLVDPDLTWSEMFTNTDKFIDNLIELTNLNLTNKNFVKYFIDEYKKTCVDPQQYFLDYSNEYWIGWCLGILKYYKVQLPFVLVELEPAQLILELKKFEEFFLEKTNTFTFYDFNT